LKKGREVVKPGTGKYGLFPKPGRKGEKKKIFCRKKKGKVDTQIKKREKKKSRKEEARCKHKQ